MERLGTLDFALLGLLAKSPASGYDIRKIMQVTPLGRYSDSPGSIYPALRRLERMRLLSGRADESGRRRYTFAMTALGRQTFRDWLTAPIGEPPLDTRMLDLRLALMSEILSPRHVRRFLREYGTAIDADVGRLTAAQAELRPQLSYSSRLALAMGITLLKHQARWCHTRSRTST
jgi:DNA-binding PadR family transcriptional regulator